MLRFHDIDPLDDPEDNYFTWRDIRAGDLVRSPNTRAYKASEFSSRTLSTRALTLGHKLLLVVSRHEGVPGEEDEYPLHKFHTFVVWSRHGALIVVKSKQGPKR